MRKIERRQKGEERSACGYRGTEDEKGTHSGRPTGDAETWMERDRERKGSRGGREGNYMT